MVFKKKKFGLLFAFVIFLALVYACENFKKSDIEELKASFELTVKLYNSGDIDGYFALIHDDVVYYTTGISSPIEGKDAVRNLYDNLLSQAENTHWESIKPKFLVNGTTGIVWSPFKHTIKWKNQSISVIKGSDTEIFTKLNGEWVKIFEHMSYFPKQETKKAATIQAIKQIHKKAAEAVKNGDVAAYVELYTEDGVYLWPGVPAIVGKDALKEWFKKRFSKYSADIEKTIEEIEVVGDWAFERGCEVSKIRNRLNNRVQVVRGKFINIFRKQKDGLWKISRRIRNLDHPIP